MNLRYVVGPLSVAGAVLTLGGHKFFVEPFEDCEQRKLKKQKIVLATEAVQRYMVKHGIPGLSIGVTVNGENVWKRGFGWADVEQMVPCTESTVMRIASISKTITSSIAARMVQSGQLKLDSPIHDYLPEFPHKVYDKKDVTVTVKQLLNHTSGIRGYKKVNVRLIFRNSAADSFQTSAVF